MSALQLEAYDIIKQKMGDKEARLLFEYIDNKVAEKVTTETKHLATKEDLMLTKEDLMKQINNVQKIIYTVGLIQFLAIVGSVIGIISFMLR